MMARLLTPFLLLLSLSYVYPYSMSADPSKVFSPNTCDNLTPGHGATPQTTASPFSVTFNPATYTPGSFGVTVTLRSCTASTFKGFIIQARRADQTADQSPLGRFTVVTGTKQGCSSAALSHSSSQEKSLVTFDWFPQNSATGHVVFRVTFVQDFNTYWVDVASQVMRDSTSSASSVGTNIIQATNTVAGCATTNPPATNAPITIPTTQPTIVTKDAACGSTQGCFSKCSANSCDFVVSWKPVGSDGEYTLTSQVSGATPYLALGFSSDGLMGDDDVIGCASTGSGTVAVFSSTNTGKSSTIYTDNAVTLVSSSLVNNILTCTIRRPKSASGQRKDIDQPWTLLLARGSATFAGTSVSQLNYHTFNGRFIASGNFTINSMSDVALGTPPSVPAPSNLLAKDPDCGSSQGCFSKCDGDNCEFLVSWKPDGSDGVYILKSPVTGATPYLALGFSSDSSMGDDDVIGCASTGSGKVAVFSSTNNGKSSTIYTDNEVQLVSSSLVDNVLTCTIRRPKSASGQRKDIDQPWTHLFARGSASVAGDSVSSINYHGGSNRYVAGQQVSVIDLIDLGSTSTERVLVKYHGSFMTIAWLFFASVGILMPRYFKNAWKDNLCQQKAWFQMHRLCMVLVLCLTSAGFVCIFVEMEEWSELVGEDSHLQAHPVMGTVVMGLTLLNPIMALFRPAPTAENRKIFNVLHYIVGQGGYTLAIVTVYFGVLLDVADTPHFVLYILIGFSVWAFVVEVLMGLSSYCCSSQDRSEAYELGKGVVERNTRVESDQGLKFKKVLLGLHVVAAAGFAITVAAMIIIGEEELED